MNPADPRTGAHLLDALRSRAIALPDPSLRVDDATASLLGTGESYAAWLVTDGTASLVFRLARRRPEDMPCPMIDEFRAGSLIPDDIGSRPLAMDDLADNPLGTPYIVATYAPGSLRVPSAWDAGLLGSLAGRLAVLHERTYPLAGSVGGAAERLDIVREFDDSYAWWQAADPEIASGPEAAALALRIRPHIVAAAPAFDGISYSLIHGDLVATNILIDERGTPRLIDWEWARIGDVANDLALIGGRITEGPGTCRWTRRRSTGSSPSTSPPARLRPGWRRSHSRACAHAATHGSCSSASSPASTARERPSAPAIRYTPRRRGKCARASTRWSKSRGAAHASP
ncbi:MAG: aminoglycoside phosphotransferase family protein [Tessaracoccus sp.]|uniref:aminoglycoside phosphotransferase family protein n=1 Tax=Tessaracoccus sp. TaxID=1971211 RepID=UPI001EC875F8|nr:aminoglycoside phosphotransferase family protein [Tessaracoccus sp.]MBK7821663.1 aminoglycoside phosphotransferase family protein [Tessaracoccus sp.]